MNIAVVDISRKVPLYDYALCDSMSERLSNNDKLLFISPPGVPYVHKSWEYSLCSFLPSFLQRKQNLVRRALKAVEVYVNYFKLSQVIRKECIDVLHMQWLPLLEINTSEIYILKYIKTHYKIKIVLTVHNMYPHNNSEKQRSEYHKRFVQICPYIDHFVVHTEQSKKDLSIEYGLDEDHISVIYHGIFKSSQEHSNKISKTKFIMFGTQSYYKGTDLFIKAYASLPKEDKENSLCTIIGKTDKKFYEELKPLVNESGIVFKPVFVEADELNKEISSSDVIVIPYRSITQSGVLLKALNFNKPIIASDLPAFKETLKGFKDEMFFKNDDYNNLASLLHKYIVGDIEIQDQLDSIIQLQNLYSWEKSADKSILLYNNIIKEGYNR